jgi:flagellin-like hook-associated protein FlgL
MSGISGVSLGSSLSIQTLVEMRNQLQDLQRQLGTGQRSQTYAGVGLDRGLTVGLRSHRSAIEGYKSTINQVNVRLDVAQTSLSQLSSLTQTSKTTVLTSQFTLNGASQTRDQDTIRIQLDQSLSLLNANSGGRYLFAGRSSDRPPVPTSAVILNGQGAQAGLKQIIDERRQADLGSNGLGRLDVTTNGASVFQLNEQAGVFGFKIASAVSNLTGSTVTGPAGSPQSLDIDLGAVNPNPGETVRLTLNLPDGSSEDLTLTATNASPPGAGEFTIGADTTATATNLQTAVTAALTKLGATSLTAASAMAAGNDFFNADAANPAQRVDGPPFDTATSLRDATATDTVSWYTGDAGSDPARSTALARADDSLSLGYGMRASEDGLRRSVQSMAVFAAMSFSASDPNAGGAYAALRNRVAGQLAGPTGAQTIADIQGELAGVQTALKASQERHAQTTNTLAQVISDVEGAPSEQVAAQILTLQTNLQATLQTTSMLLQTSLVKYL